MYFSTIALETILSSFLISPTACNDISNTISSMNNPKSLRPNSIFTKIPNLLNKDLPNQLLSVLNLSLSSEILSNIQKKVVN